MRFATTLMLAITATMMTGDVFGTALPNMDKITEITLSGKTVKVCIDASITNELNKKQEIILIRTRKDSSVNEITEKDYPSKHLEASCATFDDVERPEDGHIVEFVLVYQDTIGENKAEIRASKTIEFSVTDTKKITCGGEQLQRSVFTDPANCINKVATVLDFCYESVDLNQRGVCTEATCTIGDETLLDLDSIQDTVTSLKYDGGKFTFNNYDLASYDVIAVDDLGVVKVLKSGGILDSFQQSSKTYTFCPVSETKYGSTEFTDMDVIGVHEGGHYQFGVNYAEAMKEKEFKANVADAMGGPVGAEVTVDCAALDSSSKRCYGYVAYSADTDTLTISKGDNKIIVDKTSISNI